jgi:5-methyltetrahydropteroyltriglutamate--homocysteine methyltransferase
MLENETRADSGPSALRCMLEFELLEAFVPGIYPRSEALVQATRDLDRGRTTQEAVDEQVERDLAELVSVQQTAGLDLLADGMLRWQDHFRPLLEAAEGLETGALTRFLDTNTFYRAPTATSAAPKLSAALGDRYVAPLPGPRLVTLPSPYAFAKGTGLPPKALAEGVLKPALEALDAELVVLVEPFFARDEGASVKGLEEPLEALAGGPKLALWLTFGDARRALEQGAADLPVEALGIDFYATHATDLPESFGKLLLAGVLDARSSQLEEPREIAAFVETLRGRGVERIALVPNGDLQYVSEPIAREKVARLGNAKTATTEAAA